MKDLSHASWQVLQALVDHLSESHRMIPLETLEAATNLGIDEIVQAVSDLVTRGLVEPHPRGGLRVLARL